MSFEFMSMARLATKGLTLKALGLDGGGQLHDIRKTPSTMTPGTCTNKLFKMELLICTTDPYMIHGQNSSLGDCIGSYKGLLGFR